jgi:hypothetical protein
MESIKKKIEKKEKENKEREIRIVENEKKRRKTGKFLKVAKSTISWSLYAVRSQYFVNICKQAFHDTDLDNSGTINETELFVAVLYLYHMINLRVPGRNHKPVRLSLSQTLHNTNILHSSYKMILKTATFRGDSNTIQRV